MKNAKVKKILNIFLNVVLIMFLVICVLAVSVTIISGRDVDGAVNIFGRKMMIVTTGSMEKSEYTDVSGYEIKSIPVNSMIFVETVPDDPAEAYDWYKELKVGDVLTFKYVQSNKQITITHRIIKIQENGLGGFVIELQGDNKSSEDGAMIQRIDTSVESSNFVIGKVTGKSVVFGNIITLLKSPLGIVLMIIVPCFLIIGYEVFKITKILKEDKEKKAKDEIDAKEREIEELKKKLAEMSVSGADPDAEKPENEPAGEERTDFCDDAADKSVSKDESAIENETEIAEENEGDDDSSADEENNKIEEEKNETETYVEAESKDNETEDEVEVESKDNESEVAEN